jgi:antitoxin (DNA-binding transcriptional repressor) of toxin-antitoxin stability system
MRVVTPTDMRKRLGEILDAASAGERILIERDHKPLAWLISPEDGRRFDDKQARIARSLAALDRLRQLSERLAVEYPAPDDGLTEAEWIQQERERRMDRIDGLPHPSPEEDT